MSLWCLFENIDRRYQGKNKTTKRLTKYVSTILLSLIKRIDHLNIHKGNAAQPIQTTPIFKISSNFRIKGWILILNLFLARYSEQLQSWNLKPSSIKAILVGNMSGREEKLTL